MNVIFGVSAVLALSFASDVTANDFQLAQRVVVEEEKLTVVVYDSGEGDKYDLRGIAYYVEAMIDAFPLADYPQIKGLVDAYTKAKNSPTRENGEALEKVFASFSETIPESETARLQDVMMKAMTAGMVQIQLDSMILVVTILEEVFDTGDHPTLAEFYRAVDAFKTEPTEAGAEKSDAALEKFRSSLSGSDEEMLAIIENQASQQLTEGYAGGMVQTMITGWVDNIKDSREFLRGELGDLVSPDAFGKLEGEMSYEEVLGVIGREGDRQMSSNSEVNGVITTSATYLWSWQISPGNLGRIHACFLNDQLRVKAYDEVAD